ncbi:RDD family protein [Aquipseudomonas campi]|uniref:RDD family protein n=1 Tax=Aquipseudomonas campi TaxID=2731681 RepID=A0A6M8FHP9_9GAMM|nr:RDD family protein [Pseudomonas campi]QKE63590.1 RDD family protein [Pseudomonas campi]
MEQSQNPYQAPQADLQAQAPDQFLLASRGARLGAVLIDTLLLAMVSVPVAFLSGAFDAVKQGLEPSLMQQLTGLLVGMLAFVLIHGYLLKNYGQTVGKYLLRIAIVDLQGNVPDFLPMVAKRYLLLWVVTAIPLLGGVIGLADCLSIFRGDRRCLHDLVASTRVVQAPARF